MKSLTQRIAVVAILLINIFSGFCVCAQTHAGSSLLASAGPGASISAVSSSLGAAASSSPSPTPALNSGSGSSGSGAQSFTTWKQSQVETARVNLEKLLSSFREGSRAQKIARTDQRVRQAQLNIEIAQELTVNDYFVLYLNQFKSKEAFLDVARKLTPDETAELLLSYQKHLLGSEQPELPMGGLFTGTGTPAPTVKRR